MSVTFNAYVNVFFNEPNGVTKNKNTFISIPTFLSLYSFDFANEEADTSKYSFLCPSVGIRLYLRLLSALVRGQSTDSGAKDSLTLGHYSHLFRMPSQGPTAPIAPFHPPPVI